MFAAVGLLVAVVQGTVAEGLRTKGCVLGGDHHGYCIIQSKDHKGEKHRGHEHGLGRGVVRADAEEGDPKESNTDSGNTDNTGSEEDEDKDEEDGVVNWEDLAGDNHEPIDGLEDLVMSKEVTTAGGADTVLDLVDAGNKHRGPDNENDDNKEKSAEKLEWAKDGFDLDPGFNEPIVAFTDALSSKSFTTDESALFTNKRLELTSIPGVESTLATFAAAFELALTLAVLSELRAGCCCNRGSRNARSRLDEGQWKQSQTRGGV